ncbi:MAG TPA: hypothetical protein VMS81_00300 [Methanomicrobiales archaeon]|nr:hypothetical protein [Methanomicrobiales archaeon]
MNAGEPGKEPANPERKDEMAGTKVISTKLFFLEEDHLSDEEFEKRNRLMLISSVFFMIAGPLFIYFGLYRLTWPYTVKWGALSAAVGFLILMFAFSLWEDRQTMAMRRLFRKENRELREMLVKLEEERKKDS